MSSIKRKQFKPKKLLLNLLQMNIVSRREEAMNKNNGGKEEPLDLSKSSCSSSSSSSNEILDLSKKPIITMSDDNSLKMLEARKFEENNCRDAQPKNILINNDKPLDLRVNSKKKTNLNSIDSILNMKQIFDENFNDYNNLKSSLTKLVRGQDEWMNNSRNSFISQILKCLVCSKSFETLNDLSTHMFESKHFNKFSSSTSSKVGGGTDIIMNEQNNNKDRTMNNNNNKSNMLRKNFKTMFNSKLGSSNRSSSPTNVLLCLICKKKFTNGSYLVEHLQNNHKINQICTTCGAYFETTSAYNQHLIDEDYHHHSHHRSKQILISQSAKLRNVKRALDENEKTISFKKFIKTSLEHKVCKGDGCNVDERELIEKEATNCSNKNPLLALELFVSNNEISSCGGVDEKNSKKFSENKVIINENPLNLLQKMHSNFNNYVF